MVEEGVGWRQEIVLSEFWLSADPATVSDLYNTQQILVLHNS